jgi:uncharacterized Zn finger protein
MCKHVAATLYGVGARLDHQPELFFKLRKLDHLELIEEAVAGAGKASSTEKKTLAAADVSDIFGIELAQPATEPVAAARVTAKAAKTRQVAAPRPAAKAAKTRQVRAKAAKPAKAAASEKAVKSRKGKAKG